MRKQFLIVDTGAFLKLKQLDSFGYEVVCVVPGVVHEIRDEISRRNLQFSLVLPKVMTPTTTSLECVKKFAKATGDLGFLSETDIQLIALTHMLQCQTGDTHHLRKTPNITLTKIEVDEQSHDNASFLWSIPKLDQRELLSKTEKIQSDNKDEKKSQNECETSHNLIRPNVQDTEINDTAVVLDDDHTNNVEDNQEKFLNTNDNNKNAAEDKYNDEEEDGEEWIGEDSLEAYLSLSRYPEGCASSSTSPDDKDESNSQLRVACLSTDYSIQNVLLHMGLTALSIDGLRVKQAKSWALLCRSCKKVTLDTTKTFCPNCGNPTLRRAPLMINALGGAVVENTPFTPNLRGKVYSIPKPKGGRTGDLILCEDQIYIGGRDRLLRHQEKRKSKEKAKNDPFNEDGIFEYTGWPCGQFDHRNVTAKSYRVGFGPGNPNSNRWQKHRSKK